MSLKSLVAVAAFMAVLGWALSCRIALADETPVVQVVPNATQQGSVSAATGRRPRVGLCLGGGGMRGAAHVGVLRVLQQEGVPIDVIVGTSMGAIVGGLYSAGVSVDDMQKRFLDKSLMKSFMTVSLPVRIMAGPILLMPRALGHHPYDGLYYGNKWRNYLEAALGKEHQQIEDLKIPYAACSLNVVDGKIYALNKGSVGYAMQASSAVPSLRKPVELDGKLLVDGGVVVNVPVPQTREMGADIVIAVDVDERIKEVPLKSFRKMGSMAPRMLLLDLALDDEPLDKMADVLIHPDVDGINLISVDPKDAARAIKAGEDAARAALPEIKAKLQAQGIAFGSK